MLKIILTFIFLFITLTVATWYLIQSAHYILGDCIDDMSEIKSHYKHKIKKDNRYTYKGLCYYVSEMFYSVRNKSELEYIFQAEHEYYVIKFMNSSPIFRTINYYKLVRDINRIHRVPMLLILPPQYGNTIIKNIKNIINHYRNNVHKKDNNTSETQQNKDTFNRSTGLVEASILSHLIENNVILYCNSIAAFSRRFEAQFEDYSVGDRTIQGIFEQYCDQDKKDKKNEKKQRILPLKFIDKGHIEEYNNIYELLFKDTPYLNNKDTDSSLAKK